MTATVTIAKLDEQGRERWAYTGELVFGDERVVVARCIWQAVKPFAVGSFALADGDLFMEHYFHGQHFNIMVVYSPAGQLKGAYCNITAPAEITPDQIRWRDWFLDLLILPDGAMIELDRAEFEASAPDAVMRQASEQALQTLRRWSAERRWPLDMTGANS